MPTYVYRCLECDKRFEVQQSFSDDALTICNCEKQAPVKKVFTPVGVTFKGSGFYKTDSRSGGSKTTSAGTSSSTSSESSSNSSDSSSTASSTSSSGSDASPSTSSGTSSDKIAS